MASTFDIEMAKLDGFYSEGSRQITKLLQSWDPPIARSANRWRTQTPFTTQGMSMMHLPTLENVHLERLSRALAARQHAKGRNEIDLAQREVRAAAEAARDAGLSWTQIGDALGLARGNAYQKYRRRPAPSIGIAPPL
jgi:hypothetical protein